MKAGSKLTEKQKQNIKEGMLKELLLNPDRKQKISASLRKAHEDGKYGERRIFEKNTTSKPSTIKKYLIEERGHKCEKCNLTEWFGDKIPLTLHHRNCNKKDMRKENVDLFCPNCHTFTDNYCGKAINWKCTQEDEEGSLLNS